MLKESKTMLVGVGREVWPTPQEYNEAMQNLEFCFADPEIQTGSVQPDSFGLPRPITGGFASVYKVTSAQKTYAVRCFLTNTRDVEERYARISEYVMNDSLPYTVAFEFLHHGVRIRGKWFPILKMDWVEGKTLDLYIEENLSQPEKLLELILNFRTMCVDLDAAGIAHGDLQHGNIIVTPHGELRLVDYDGMFVPSMKEWYSNELGHRHYQHPLRKATDFGPAMDTFSMNSIYLSLIAVAEDPGLYTRCNAGADCLLLRKTDYEKPLDSVSVKAILSSGSPQLVRRLRQLLWLCTREPLYRLPLDRKIPEDILPSLSPLVQQQPTTKATHPPAIISSQVSSTPDSRLSPDQRTLFLFPQRDVRGRYNDFCLLAKPEIAEEKRVVTMGKLAHELMIVLAFIFFGILFYGFPTLVFWLCALWYMIFRMDITEKDGDRWTTARLVQAGTPVMGEVYSSVIPQDSESQRPFRRVTYVYGTNTVFGLAYRSGVAEYDLVPKHGDAPIAGDKVIILYDPCDVKNSLIYDYCEYMASPPQYRTFN